MTAATAAPPPKCPCCNNPWAAATGDFFAKLCETCEETTAAHGGANKALNRANMDFDVSPQDNFYKYANGNWIRNNPIPAGYPSWNSFLTLHVQSQERCKELLTELQQQGAEAVTNDSSSSSSSDNKQEEAQKVAAFYTAAMDEDAIEAAGTDPLQKVLELVDETVQNLKHGNTAAYAACLGKLLYQYGIASFFPIGSSPDSKNTEWSICQLSQGGIGLPDRDYYFDDDKEEQRQKYKRHIAKQLTLLQDPTKAVTTEEPTDEMKKAAEAIYELEQGIAEKHMTATEKRDPHATYNKMTLDELSQKCNGVFDFPSYFVHAAHGKGSEGLGGINVRQPDSIQRTSEVAASVSPDTLRHFLRWKVIHSCAPYLSKVFVEENFDFYERILSGTQEMKPRWKRAMAMTESAVGEALGKLYCARYFDESSKERALAIVEQVRAALEERLKEVEWMQSSSTREEALKKMSRFGVKIGYPDKWIDYSPLHFDKEKDTFMDMVFKAREFENSLEVKEMNAKTDKKQWFMTPQTVNAYYHPNLNEIVFPAAILQHPFFDKDADDAVNFGAMGAVVGHEMTHGFDDKGRKFNFEGNMVDWWTEDDSEEYEKRVEVMVNQADAYRVHDQAVKGKLTCGENIADLGGLRLAYRALRNTKGFDDTKLVDGFTPTQRFFLAWAQCWRQNITKERSLQLLTIDPHGPNEMRCNGPLSNIKEFHEAFEVNDENAPMFVAVDKRVDIW